MKLISVDPGYDRVGVAILEKSSLLNGGSGKETVLFSTCITTNRTDGFYDRLKQIQTELAAVIEEYKPEILVMEELYFANNAPTALKVSEARGIISGEALRLGILVAELHPNHVKIAITGHGGAKKSDILFMLPKLIAVDVAGKLDDELDAIAIGVAYFAHTKFPS